MKFSERDEGDYRIYAGAFEAAVGGYYASVVIVRVHGARGTPTEAYRAEMLDDARAFNREEIALEFALTHACNVIRCRPAMLAC